MQDKGWMVSNFGYWRNWGTPFSRWQESHYHHGTNLQDNRRGNSDRPTWQCAKGIKTGSPSRFECTTQSHLWFRNRKDWFRGIWQAKKWKHSSRTFCLRKGWWKGQQHACPFGFCRGNIEWIWEKQMWRCTYSFGKRCFKISGTQATQRRPEKHNWDIEPLPCSHAWHPGDCWSLIRQNNRKRVCNQNGW